MIYYVIVGAAGVVNGMVQGGTVAVESAKYWDAKQQAAKRPSAVVVDRHGEVLVD